MTGIIITALILATALCWIKALLISYDFGYLSKKQIAVRQMLLAFWPIGLVVIVPYLIIIFFKASISWFVNSIKIIFGKE